MPRQRVTLLRLLRYGTPYRSRLVWAIVGMNNVRELADRPILRQIQHLDQGRGEIDHPGVEIDVVGARTDADRLHGERG